MPRATPSRDEPSRSEPPRLSLASIINISAAYRFSFSRPTCCNASHSLGRIRVRVTRNRELHPGIHCVCISASESFWVTPSIQKCQFVHALCSRDRRRAENVGENVVIIARDRGTLYPIISRRRRSLKAAALNRDGQFSRFARWRTRLNRIQSSLRLIAKTRLLGSTRRRAARRVVRRRISSPHGGAFVYTGRTCFTDKPQRQF